MAIHNSGRCFYTARSLQRRQSLNRGQEGMCTLSRPNRGPSQQLIWRGLRKRTGNLRIAGVSTKFRTERLLNVSLELLHKSPREGAGTTANGSGIAYLLCNRIFISPLTRTCHRNLHCGSPLPPSSFSQTHASMIPVFTPSLSLYKASLLFITYD